LAYAMEFPNHVHRAHYLTATGHGYWWLAVAAGVASGVLAVSIVATFRLQARATGREIEPVVARHLAPRLAAIQLVIYLALEITERLVSAPSADGAGLGLLVRGSLAQAFVAVAVALLLAGLARFVSRARAVGPVLIHQRPTLAIGSGGSLVLVLRPQARPVGSRAPPRP
jgi:hypothetical protein